MRLRDFKELSLQEQLKILWEEGALIDSCMESQTRKLLFAIRDFYVELWFHAGTDKLLWVLSFKQGKLLEKYLDKYNFRPI